MLERHESKQRDGHFQSSALVPFDEEERPESDPQEAKGQAQPTKDCRSDSRLLHLHSCKHTNTHVNTHTNLSVFGYIYDYLSLSLSPSVCFGLSLNKVFSLHILVSASAKAGCWTVQL